MQESNLRKCKKCLVMKQRTQVGKYDQVNKKYTDEQNRLWSGSTCPTCHAEKVRLNMEQLRKSRKESSNEQPSN